MDQKKKERWIQLCELASTEQDPDRLMRLVVEISRLLDDKNQSLKTENESLKTEEGESGKQKDQAPSH